MLRILTILIAVAALAAVDAPAKPLYLCDDGRTVLLTDDASRGCAAYEPQADLITVPNGATWADVEWAVAVKSAERPEPLGQRAERVLADVCALWLDLNLETSGGLDMKTSENTRKWLAFSRIVTSTNVCEEYLANENDPPF